MALKYNGHTFRDAARCVCCIGDKRVVVVDPTNTARLRASFAADFRKHWQVLKQATREMIDKQDILGLKGSSALQIVAPGITLSGTRVEMFARWFDVTIRRAVYGNDGTWLSPYLEQAFQMGTKFGQEQIGNNQIVGKDSQHRFDALTSLARNELQGIMAAVLQQATRIVSLGITTGEKPMTIVRGIWLAIDKTGNTRSSALLAAMTIKTFNEAVLDVYEAAGVQNVGLVPESAAGKLTDAETQSEETTQTQDAPRKIGPGSRSRKATPSRSTIQRIRRAERNLARAVGTKVNVRTAGDELVCPICEAIAENGPYTLNRARQLIPAHPHCRCTFIPADDRRFAQDTRDVQSSPEFA